MADPRVHLVKRDSGEYEQVVLAEVLVPDVPNVFGDIYTEEAIREFVYEFARQGYGIDVNHDETNIDHNGAYVVEYFIAREGDPTFIKGSWVVGTRITDPEIWDQILKGEINGYSYQAECLMYPIIAANLRSRIVVGVTEPDPMDGHTHTYAVALNGLNKPVSGATGVSSGHSHRIVSHTVTESGSSLFGAAHVHRYQVVVEQQEGDTNVE